MRLSFPAFLSTAAPTQMPAWMLAGIVGVGSAFFCADPAQAQSVSRKIGMLDASRSGWTWVTGGTNSPAKNFVNDSANKFGTLKGVSTVTDTTLSDVAVFVAILDIQSGGANAVFTTDEARALRRFVDRGGSLVVFYGHLAGNSSLISSANTFGSNFGVNFQQVCVPSGSASATVNMPSAIKIGRFGTTNGVSWGGNCHETIIPLGTTTVQTTLQGSGHVEMSMIPQGSLTTTAGPVLFFADYHNSYEGFTDNNARILLGNTLDFAMQSSTTGIPADDRDLDGITNNADAAPCDANVSSIAFSPAANSHGMLLLEDNWPANGDLDFNDAVVAYHEQFFTNTSGKVSRVRMVFDVQAVGASGIDSGLAIHLPISRQQVGTITKTFRGSTTTLSSENNETDVVVRVLDNLASAFSNGQQDSFINTDSALPIRGSDPVVVEISFLAPQTLNTSNTANGTANAPFDLFFFRTGNFGHQIHMPQFAGTQQMNTALFGTEEDRSNASRHFVNQNGIPFVLNLPATSVYPKEFTDISFLYPRIVSFGLSAGNTDADFFNTPVNIHAFSNGAGGANGGARLSPQASFLTFDTDRSCLVGDPNTYKTLLLSLSPSGYWPLDESSGSVANDLSGNARHGTYNGLPSLGTVGQVGNAVNFAGDGFVVTPVTLDTLFADSSDGTVVALAKTPSTYQTATFSSYPSHSLTHHIWSNDEYFQGVSVGTFDGVSGLHFWNFYTGSNDHRVSRAVNPNTWIHMAWVKSAGTFTSYINGEPVSVTAPEGIAGRGQFFIGVLENGGFRSPTYPSQIQHVAAYPQALTEAQIDSMVQAAGL